MFFLGVKGHLDGAHKLRDYSGKCAELHGHRWSVEAVFGALSLDKMGMAYDFGVLKKSLRAVLDELDHKYLNEIQPFDKMNPTAENLARYIFEKLKIETPGELFLHEVRVWETPENWAAYRQEDHG